MTPDQTLIDRMQARGLRMTWQRRILAELLEQAHEHLDAEKLYQLAHRRDPRIHRATVYRMVNGVTQRPTRAVQAGVERVVTDQENDE